MRFNPLKPTPPPAADPLSAPRRTMQPPARRGRAPVFTTTLTENERGTALHLRFPQVPPEDTRKQLKGAGWFFSGRHMAWVQ